MTAARDERTRTVPRYPRLSAEDLINLSAESPGTPMHMVALAVLDRPAEPVHLSAVRERIGARLGSAPRLRQILHRPGPLAGHPVWIDDPGFAIERHVNELRVSAPGDQQALLRLTERLMMPLLDRTRPLWRMWLVTGLPDGRLAIVFILHHVVADGLAAVRLITSLLDESVPPPAETAALPPPRWAELVRDSLLTRRPARASALRSVSQVLRHARRAPCTSLNGPVGPEHRLSVLRIDLATARETAHRYGGTINDLVLDLAAGGLRALLRARHESVDRLHLHTSVAVSLRPADATTPPAGNRTGAILIRLPVSEPDPGARLRAIAAETARAKREQPVTAGTGMLALLSRLGVARWFARHQRMVNLVESDMVGPPDPVRLLSVPMLDLVPVGNLAGNVGISFLAVSYAGRLTITVQADAARFPDLPVLLAGARRDWAVLTTVTAPVPGRREGEPQEGEPR